MRMLIPQTRCLGDVSAFTYRIHCIPHGNAHLPTFRTRQKMMKAMRQASWFLSGLTNCFEPPPLGVSMADWLRCNRFLL